MPGPTALRVCGGEPAHSALGLQTLRGPQTPRSSQSFAGLSDPCGSGPPVKGGSSAARYPSKGVPKEHQVLTQAQGGMKPTTVPAGLAVWLAAEIVAAQMLPRQPPPTAMTREPPAAGNPAAGVLPAPYLTRQTDLEIPFTVRPGSSPEQQPTAVRIFVSWDRGATWHFYDQRRAEEGRFRFRPRQDGEFWFTTQTLDARGQPDSPQPRAAQLRLIVDTQRPQLLVQAQVDGSGNVQLTCSAADAHLLPASLKVEYQDASGHGGPWQAVELPPPPDAAAATWQVQKTFRPAVTSAWINLRAEVADAAGNMAFFSQRLSLQPPPAQPPASAPPLDPSATPWVTNQPAPSTTPPPSSEGDVPLAETMRAGPPAPGASDRPEPASPPVSTAPPLPGMVTNPYVGPGRLASTSAGPGRAERLSPVASGELSPAEAPSRPEGSSSVPLAADDLPLPAPSTDLPSASPPLRPETAPEPNSPSPPEPLPAELPPPAGGTRRPAEWPMSDPEPRADPSSPPGASEPPAAPPEPWPQAEEPLPSSQPHRPRLTNSRRFRLEYDLETVGPQGVAAVELWGTSDGGRTWLRWGRDPDATSPLEVEVAHEGLYGFRIVVVGKHGLATSAPQPGDAADIWVGVDLTRPSAKLLRAAYGEGAMAGKLDIRWQADDAHLGLRPITLLVGERPDGPFSVIAAGLPNTGQYWWDPQPRVPRQLFLRLEVRDEAGNVAIDQLTEPIRVEGLEPKGRIRELRPADAPLRGASAGPSRIR